MEKIFKEPTQTPSSQMSQAAKSALKDFFFGKLLWLENTAEIDYKFTKQTQIQKLQTDIEKLINANRYAFFEVVILEANCDDIDNVDAGVIVKNFRHFLVNRQPDKFRIIINQTWSGFTIYQRSIDDFYWNIIK